MSDSLSIRYVPDDTIGADLDGKLRALFLDCFPREAHFLTTQRYFHECPAHRWIAFDGDHIAAHVALHDKIVGSSIGDLRLAGIAEVCVARAYRGQKLVKSTLEIVHQWALTQNFDFAMLFGAHYLYSSSGYRNIDNELHYLDTHSDAWVTKSSSYAMIRPLRNQDWPQGKIDLRGPMF